MNSNKVTAHFRRSSMTSSSNLENQSNMTKLTTMCDQLIYKTLPEHMLDCTKPKLLIQ